MPQLDAPTRARLVAHARESLRAAARHEPVPSAEPVPCEHGGVFVTLKKNGELRGCIGRFDGRADLAQLVGEMTHAAALEDPRFPAVDIVEVEATTVSISRLSPLSTRVRPQEIVVGEHGVQLELRGRRSVFLPSVAVEQGWDRTQLLEALCRKAGLPAEAWREPAARLHVFRAEVFGE